MGSIGTLLRDRARKLGLSDSEVARRAGLDPRRYGHYVLERRQPDLKTLVRICMVLGISPQTLIGGLMNNPTPGDDFSSPARAELVSRILSAVRPLSDAELEMTAAIIETIVRFRVPANAS